MQLEVFGELAVAVRAGAIGGNDRIVAIAVFARNRRKRGHWCPALCAWNAQFVALQNRPMHAERCRSFAYFLMGIDVVGILRNGCGYVPRDNKQISKAPAP